jgi:Thrombospondin type 3 repeat
VNPVQIARCAVNPVQIARPSIRLFWLAIILRSAIAGAALAVDTDGDRIDDYTDNCTLIANGSQCDTDRDGYGNRCDGDFDENQKVNAYDFEKYLLPDFRMSADSGTGTDMDCSGSVNSSDLANFFEPQFKFAQLGPSGLPCAGTVPCVDGDQDGVPNDQDNCTALTNTSQLDGDRDGYGNRCDFDFDNDGAVTLADVDVFACSNDPLALGGDLDENGVLNSWDFTLAGVDSIFEVGGYAPGPSGVATATPTASDNLRDDDGDGILNFKDTCKAIRSEDPNRAWNDDGDRFGRICDPDYDEDGDADQADSDAFMRVLQGTDPYNPEMDHDGNGIVNSSDWGLIAPVFMTGEPGPSGTLCAAATPAVASATATSKRHWVLRDAELVGDLPDWDSGEYVEVSSGPACGRVANCLTLDLASRSFRFVSDPQGTADSTAFTYSIRESFTGVVTSIGDVTIEFFDSAESVHAANDLAPGALVVYNTNAAEAQTIAQHYRVARGLAANQLCPVQMPTGTYASKDELLGARKQILTNCICPAIPSGQRPADCAANPAATAQVSPFTHLVMVRGLPSRLFGTGWRNDEMEPALDPYLAWLLYNDASEMLDCAPGECKVGPNAKDLTKMSLSNLIPYLSQPNGFAQLRYPRALDPRLDRFLAYGRIEAMTTARTLDLIDDTLAAEARGFVGNVVTEGAQEFEPLRELTGSLASQCVGYTGNSSTWPHAACRTGTTASTSAAQPGGVPGEANTEIPQAVGVGLMLGTEIMVNGHHGFDGFATMKNWRKSGASCNPLCANQACSTRTFDYFGELDSSCVGGAPGLMGFQLRSFPVSYYGFYPAGWATAGTGHEETTPGLVLAGGAAAGQRYLHLGAHDVGNRDASLCTRSDGSVVGCAEHVVTYLVKDISFATARSNSNSFWVSFAHRNQTAGTLQVMIQLIDSSGKVSTDIEAVPLAATTSTAWHVAGPVTLAATSPIADVKSVHLELTAPFSGGFGGFLDLDDVRLVDARVGDQLLTAAVGSFEDTQHAVTHLGDYASNAIDRLGAIAWWGSSSHFLTGGLAFADAKRVARAIFAGRSLGESVAQGRFLESGLFYGDPLYRPSAAAIYFVPASTSKRSATSLGDISTSGQLITARTKATYRDLFINVLHGADHIATVNWEISTCTGPPGVPIAAETCASWITQPVQTGAVKEHRIRWLDDLIDDRLDQFVVIRLKVWNAGEEDQALYDFAYLDYRANSM